MPYSKPIPEGFNFVKEFYTARQDAKEVTNFLEHSLKATYDQKILELCGESGRLKKSKLKGEDGVDLRKRLCDELSGAMQTGLESKFPGANEMYKPDLEEVVYGFRSGTLVEAVNRLVENDNLHWDGIEGIFKGKHLEDGQRNIYQEKANTREIIAPSRYLRNLNRTQIVGVINYVDANSWVDINKLVALPDNAVILAQMLVIFEQGKGTIDKRYFNNITKETT